MKDVFFQCVTTGCIRIVRLGVFCELCAYAFVSAKTSKTSLLFIFSLKINKFMKTKSSNYQRASNKLYTLL